VNASRGMPPGTPSRRVPHPLALAALAMLLASLAAFWPPYLSRLSRPIDVYTHLHAAIGTAWVLLLVAQPLAVQRGALALHRRMGRISYALAPAFVVSGVLLAHHRFSRMNAQVFAQEAFTLYLPLLVAGLFALAYGLGLLQRKRRAVHSRLMACTLILLIDPVLGRLMYFNLPPFPGLLWYQAITFSVTGALVLALLRSLPARAPGYWSVATFAGVVVTGFALWFVVPPTAPWLQFAAWFRGLPLT
jgi:uncharacterized membrane protein YozB (DUF420 family)